MAGSNEIRFEDGAAYEQMMGRWSRLAGDRFLDWLALPPGARWVDVGCGNGAFTELLVKRARAADVQALDPSPGQLAYARERLPANAPVTWHEADAMRLPLRDGSADVAAMALVLFFVPEPAVGVAEMCRVVRAGGTVAAYHWDILGGGFPLAAIGSEMKRRGIPPRLPPSVEASTLEASTALWERAGLQRVQATSYTVERRFDSFDEYWNTAASSNTLRPMFEAMTADNRDVLKAAVRERLQAGDDEPLRVSARCNAVKGVKG